MIRPHDLLWINDKQALSGDLPPWVSPLWNPAFPLVVRRDEQSEGRIPVGVRGMTRSQRAAAWVSAAAISRLVTPEMLVADINALLRSPFVSLPPVQALIMLHRQVWPFSWGVTGSCGYALATEIPVMHAQSDLDIVVRCPTPVDSEILTNLAETLHHLPCRADAQIETAYGGFALNEWLRGGPVLLKTARGPIITTSPWAPAEDA